MAYLLQGGFQWGAQPDLQFRAQRSVPDDGPQLQMHEKLLVHLFSHPHAMIRLFQLQLVEVLLIILMYPWVFLPFLSGLMEFGSEQGVQLLIVLSVPIEICICRLPLIMICLFSCYESVGEPQEQLERLRGWHRRVLHLLSLLLLAWYIVCLVGTSLRPPCSAKWKLERQSQELEEACSSLTFAFVALIVGSVPMLLASFSAPRALCLCCLLAELEQDALADYQAAVSELMLTEVAGLGISQEDLAQWFPSHRLGSDNASLPSKTPSAPPDSAVRFESCLICLEDVVGGQD
ncbi:unnamed protein product, partial [Polarella glacialis]